MILNPQHLKIFGENISIGDYATLICSSDKKIDISTWQTDKLNGSISLGNYILISPGTSIRSAESIDIGDSTMIASDVVITDSDWHGIYDRTDYVATPKPVKIHKNVWIGERSIILKGTQIGENSIIAAMTGISGSTEIGKNAMIGGQVGISGHVRIGDNVKIAAKSGIMKDIPNNSNIGGYPAENLIDWHRGTIFIKKNR